MFYLLTFILCLFEAGLIGLVMTNRFPLNGYPVVMIGPLFLFFVVQALKFHSNPITYNYIDEWMFTFSSFVCLVSFLSVLIGWCYVDIKYKKLVSHRKPSKTYYSYNRLFTIGTICHIVSLIAELLIAKGRLLTLYSRPHAFYESIDNPILGYLFFLTFIGTVLYLQCFFSNKNLSRGQQVTMITVCILQLLKAIIVGQRAWILNLIFIYITIPFFCIGKWPKIRQVAYFLLPAFMFVIILPFVRGHIYLGSSDFRQLPEIFIQAMSDEESQDSSSAITQDDGPNRIVISNEFVLGTAIISKAWEKNEYTYGLSFYDFLINPIPRALWPEKPLNIGQQTWHDIVDKNFPWHFNNGAAPTGIADVFLNFGFFCIPFWFIFGIIHRLFYDLASKQGNFYAQGIYVCLLWGSTYLLNQSVLFWGTQIMFVLFFMTLLYSYARVIRPDEKPY